jgi:aspartate/methionine/tyrosine aminotransferase
MGRTATFKICPTASNSIDIIGAVLAQAGHAAHLIEPTFDNLALILRRRGVPLQVMRETDVFDAVAGGELATFLEAHRSGALFLVQPNNPTGRSLSASAFQIIAEHCAEQRTVLVVDNSFRFYNRHPFDDYSILLNSGASFLSFEDTGKVWPTHDLKASLLFCSDDLEPAVTAVYNELFLGTSRFSLALLEECILRTSELGLANTIWPQIDERRALLRRSIVGTGLVTEPSSIGSHTSVEWLNVSGTHLDDVALAAYLATENLQVLPGRHFFWQSGGRPECHDNIRIALMKPLNRLLRALDVLTSLLPVPACDRR